MTAPVVAASSVAADDLPIHAHPWYELQREDWEKVRDLMAGTRAVRKKGALYLPKHAAEQPDDYELRLKLGVVYNGFKRTLQAMTGLVMQRPVELGQTAGKIAEHWESIDGRRGHGAVFARRVFTEGLATNWCGILVDMQPLEDEGGVRSRADEARLGLRPYWRLYKAEDIRDWQWTEYQGEQVLRLLVLRECYQERVGRFRIEERVDYRVIEWRGPGEITWELWREEGDRGNRSASLVRRGSILGPERIPFSFFTPNEVYGPPPLIDLADLNLTHYRTDTDRRHLMRIGCLPIPVRIGYPNAGDEPEKPFGTNRLLDVPLDGDFKWAEITGAAFGVTGEDLRMIEARMGAMGLAFLQPETRAAETAEAKRIDSTAQNATLASAARALKDCLEEAVIYHAQFLKVAPVGVEVNTDFERTVLPPQMIDALSRLEVAGQLSLETLLAMLKRGHVLGDDTDVEEELARIMQRRAEQDRAAAGGQLPDEGEEEDEEEEGEEDDDGPYRNG